MRREHTTEVKHSIDFKTMNSRNLDFNKTFTEKFKSPQSKDKIFKEFNLKFKEKKKNEKVALAQINQRDKRQKAQRELSTHIVSRWYRPPEIILAEKQYDFSVDMWSLGCVLFELIHCTYKKPIDDRFPFRGMSCFPLSPFH